MSNETVIGSSGIGRVRVPDKKGTIVLPLFLFLSLPFSRSLACDDINRESEGIGRNETKRTSCCADSEYESETKVTYSSERSCVFKISQ